MYVLPGVLLMKKFPKKKETACKTFFKKLGYALGFVIIFPVHIIHSIRTVSKIKKEKSELLNSAVRRERDMSEIEILEVEKKLIEYKTTKRIISHYSRVVEYAPWDFVLLTGVGLTFYAFLAGGVVHGPIILAKTLMWGSPSIFLAVFGIDAVIDKTNYFILWSKILPKSFEKSLLNHLYEPPLKKLLEEQFQQTLKQPLKKTLNERKEIKELRITIPNSTPNMYEFIFLQKKNDLQIEKLTLLEETLDLLNITHNASFLIKGYLFPPQQFKRLNTYRFYDRDLIDPYYVECIKELKELRDTFTAFNLDNDSQKTIQAYLFSPEKMELCHFYQQLNRKNEIIDTNQISFLSEYTKRSREKTKKS